MNLPNLLTLARILLIPFFVLVYIFPGQWTYLIAAALFGLAAFTDWLDGYLARRLQQTTPFGAFLDPVADKLIVVSALVVLIGHHANLWLTVPALIIVGREIVISALREWMAEMNRRGKVSVVWLGRVKTTFQMVAIAVLLANPPNLDRPFVLLGYGLLYAAVVLTLWSMVLYLKAAWPTLKSGWRQR
jgi:CDP-diacylglycerol---glycerol-3-phosphate 3-phosphatidyltransferase